jgi:Bacterial PH domain/Short C-terminal domain
LPTLEEIKAQLEHLDGVSKLFGRKEIKELPNILWEDEKLEKLVQGFYAKGNGILVATNKRLIFIDKGLMYGLRVEDFPYDKISSIQYSTGMLLGKITIFTSGNKALIEQIDKSQVKQFGEYVRARISGSLEHASYQSNDKQSPPQPTEVRSSGVDDELIEALERLGKLKEQGILTEEEFTAKKKQLLGI